MSNTSRSNSIVLFISTLIRYLPELSEERMSFWLKAPNQLKKFLNSLNDEESPAYPNHSGTLGFGRLVFSLRVADALLDDLNIGLSQGELILLLSLCEAEDIATVEYILDRGRKGGYDWSTTLHGTIKRVRDKIKDLNIMGAESLIIAVPNVGYKINKKFLSAS